MTNGYVIYPSCTSEMSLRKARAIAKRESTKEPGYARVESSDTGKLVGTYKWGDRI